MTQRIIVCAVIQDINKEKIILGKKAKGRAPYPDVWHTPGGGVSNITKARNLLKQKDFNNFYFHKELRREIKEELNISIKNVKYITPMNCNNPREAKTLNKDKKLTHYIFLEYLCDYDSGTLKPSDDLAEARWFKKSELKVLNLTPPSQAMYKELGWI